MESTGPLAGGAQHGSRTLDALRARMLPVHDHSFDWPPLGDLVLQPKQEGCRKHRVSPEGRLLLGRFAVLARELLPPTTDPSRKRRLRTTCITP